MATTRISKGPKAPDGPLRFSLSGEYFVVDSDKTHETEDANVLADLQAYVEREWVVLDGDSEKDAAEAADEARKAEAAAIKQYEAEVAAAEKANAERTDIVTQPTVQPEHASHVEILEEAASEEAPAEEDAPAKTTTRKGAKS